MELWGSPFVWAALPVGKWGGVRGWGLGDPLESILPQKKKKNPKPKNYRGKPVSELTSNGFPAAPSFGRFNLC